MKLTKLECCDSRLCLACLVSCQPAGSIALLCPICCQPSIRSGCFPAFQLNVAYNDKMSSKIDAANKEASPSSSTSLLSLNPLLTAGFDILDSQVRARWLDLQKERQVLTTISESLSQESAKEQERLSTTFCRLRELLDNREKLLRTLYDNALSTKFDMLKSREHQIDQLELTIDDDKLLDLRQLFPRLSALGDILAPKFAKIDLDDIEKIVDNFGHVFSPSDNMTFVVNSSLSDDNFICCINRKSRLAFSLSDTTVIKQGLKIFVVNYLDKRVCEAKILQNNLAEFTLTMEGLYNLEVFIDDGGSQKIQHGPVRVKCVGELEYSNRRLKSSSPTKSITVESSLNFSSEDLLMGQLGHRGHCLGQFTNPQSVCCTRNSGHVIVTDSNSQCVQIFNATDSGDCVMKFGTKGRGSGQLMRPTGVTCTQNETLLVADYENKWVARYKLDGTYLGRFGASGNLLLGPKGVTVHHGNQDHVIIIDNRSSWVLVFDPVQHRLIRKFGGRGDREDQLAGPHYAVVDQFQRLLVTDFHHHCVKIFELASGEYLDQFGCQGEGNGQFNAPTGIAIDDQQRVYVADWGNNRIQVWFHFLYGCSMQNVVKNNFKFFETRAHVLIIPLL